MPARPPSDGRAIEEVFWIVLGRAPSPVELRDEMRGGERRTLLLRVLSSPEFQMLRTTWKAGRSLEGDGHARERGLRALGTDEGFVQRAYDCLLGRPADESGFRHYTAALAAGETRTNLIRSLALSGEFERRMRDLAPESAVIPRDTQLCELANPAKWDNPEWLDLLRSLGLSDDKMSMHRKPYEFTQLIFGCRRLGMLREDARVLSVGAGHEHVVYW